MLPVARIAQSVEQGIENPRVLGSIPSPGTIFREPSLWLGFCFSGTGLSIELRSIIRPKASPYGPALKRCSTRRQRRLSESGRPIQKNPPMAGFSLSGVRTLHRTAFDYSAKGLTLRASAKALFNPAPAPVVQVRSPYLENPAYGWVFRYLEYGLSIELRSIIRPKASPCGSALKRCSTRRQRRLSESGRPIQKNPLGKDFHCIAMSIPAVSKSLIRWASPSSRSLSELKSTTRPYEVTKSVVFSR